MKKRFTEDQIAFPAVTCLRRSFGMASGGGEFIEVGVGVDVHCEVDCAVAGGWVASTTTKAPDLEKLTLAANHTAEAGCGQT